MPHTKVVKKLNIISGENTAADWVQDFLCDGNQLLYYERQESPKVRAISGVPQGSVLSPLLFLFFIKDLTHNLDAKVRLFADDCIIYRGNNNEGDQITLNKRYERKKTLGLITGK